MALKSLRSVRQRHRRFVRQLALRQPLLGRLLESWGPQDEMPGSPGRSGLPFIPGKLMLGSEAHEAPRDVWEQPESDAAPTTRSHDDRAPSYEEPIASEEIAIAAQSTSIRPEESAPGREDQPENLRHDVAADSNQIGVTSLEVNPEPLPARGARKGRHRRIVELDARDAVEKGVKSPSVGQDATQPEERAPTTEVEHHAVAEAPPSDGQPAPVQASGELFAPRQTDRTPGAWLQRLQAAAGSRTVAPEEQRAAGVRQATPVAQSTRHLLTALVGVDPEGVRRLRGGAVDHAVGALRADAATDGESVALASTIHEDTPEGIGLLAHELTHSARRQNPRFVPPVVRDATNVGPNSSLGAPLSASVGARSVEDSSGLPEESLAQVAEVRVTAAARAERSPDATAMRNATPRAIGPAQHVVERDATPAQHPDRDLWGDLPAPWEPLPQWFAETVNSPVVLEPTRSRGSEGGGASPSDGRAVSSTGLGEAARGDMASATGIHTAEQGRSLSTIEEETAPASQPPPHHMGVPEPDLDALAQQVHAILKRRLAAERRRSGW